jgi:hypothetical protein
VLAKIYKVGYSGNVKEFERELNQMVAEGFNLDSWRDEGDEESYGIVAVYVKTE